MGFFIVALVLSGATAFFLPAEVRWTTELLRAFSGDSTGPLSGLYRWFVQLNAGIQTVNRDYPFMLYGTDWLAFGHIVIAIFFLQAYRNPRESGLILMAGMIACALVPVLALVCGPIRGIPLYWRLIDCSFGVLGILPLVYCRRVLARLQSSSGGPGM